ncbi:sulfatase [Blastopirellula marina]|uniref:Sulfatase n=1 Tax=Blastopirellula marina TaxID=124 RepID=A0A2S8F1D9_9BACT|nr:MULTISPECIES: DUF1501 domain-containing protein [Pirellulaceae]PQO25995.1 sulfatase [Blastopirellula marina]RCS44353.1 DUF1501 domain-containing protein [Bremerella cremea]
MFDPHEAAIRQTRRTFLGQGMAGLGTAALASLMNASTAHANEAPGLFPNFAPKAKRVIVLCQAGGPSHLETFDEKPELKRLNDQPMPESFTKGQPIAQLQGRALKCYAPRFDFNHYGESGQSIVSLFPKMGEIADDLCIINSMVTEQINHDPAHTFMNTGTSISGRPSMGSWVQYGLGSEADDLPGFVVLTSVGKGGQAQPIAARQWHSGFLPSRYQGVEFRSTGDPVLYVQNPPGITTGRQRDVVDAVNQMNALRQPMLDDPEIATRIAQYELAFKMQTSVPSLMDVSGEPQHILDMYGTKGADGTFAANCLLARRLAERGVRFVQLYHRGWDHHGGIERGMQICASEVDQASAALVTDLKNRGMLDETLVVWGGEFGRTPMAQGSGRDHHIKGFSIWMAGGGIKGGIKYGKTDELGYNAVEDIVHVHDFHATLLHLLGINHEKLTVRHQGRDFRLTDVHGRVVKEILA